MKSELSFVYMVRCAKNQLYTGWTNDAQARLYAHKTGVGAKFTRGFSAQALAYLEQLPDKSAGLRREAALKKLPKAEKEALCAAWAQRVRPRILWAAPQDAAEVYAAAAWYAESAAGCLFGGFLPGLEADARRPAAQNEAFAALLEGAPVLLARDGAGALLGFALAKPLSPAAACAACWEIAVCCAPGARGVGAGDALFAALSALGGRLGVQGMAALLALPNAPAEAFCKKHGFTCTGRLPHIAYAGGKWHDAACWHLALAARHAPPAVLPLPLAGAARAALLEAVPAGTSAPKTPHRRPAE